MHFFYFWNWWIWRLRVSICLPFSLLLQRSTDAKKKFQAFRPLIYTIQTHPEIVLTSRKICPKNISILTLFRDLKRSKFLQLFFSSVVHLHNNSISRLCTLIWPFWYVNQHVQRGAEWRGSSYFIIIFSFFKLMTNNASTSDFILFYYKFLLLESQSGC